MRRFVRFSRVLAVVWLLAGITPLQAQNQGLTPAELQDWYHLSQGTEVFPYRFLRAIKDFDTGKPFIEDLDRFGFILDPKSEYGVPIGMSVSDTRDLRFAGVKMIGLNCSACHTAEMTFQNKRVRFDGGTNMLNANAFSDGIKDSIEKTLGSPLELLAFISRLAEQELEARADDSKAARLGLSLLNKSAPFTRKSADLLGKLAAKTPPVGDLLLASAAKKLIAQELARDPLKLRKGMITRKDDPRLPDAKAKLEAELAAPRASLKLGAALSLLPGQADIADSLHQIITTVRLLRARFEILTQPDGAPGKRLLAGHGRVDAFGAARNRLFPANPITLSAPVRFPFLWEIPVISWYHWDGNTTSALERNVGEAIGVGVVVDMDTKESTLQLDNLITLEGYATNLPVPAWPEDVFGKIDRDLAKQGEKWFGTHCAKCHSIPAKGDKVADQIVPFVDAMGKPDLDTDTQRVVNIRKPVGGVNFFDAISPILQDVLQAAGGPAPGKANHWRPSTTNQPGLPEGHPNRPIRAVWASPPYLHNGSVPSIYELLLPPEKRTPKFHVGHREYDPRKLGYTLQTDSAPSLTLIDTTLFGNHNTGHVYGADTLTDADRYAIIEYLKTR